MRDVVWNRKKYLSIFYIENSVSEWNIDYFIHIKLRVY